MNKRQLKKMSRPLKGPKTKAVIHIDCKNVSPDARIIGYISNKFECGKDDNWSIRNDVQNRYIHANKHIKLGFDYYVHVINNDHPISFELRLSDTDKSYYEIYPSHS